MASSFAEAYLRKREKERAAQTPGVNKNGTYVNPETGRVEQVGGAGNSAERFAGIVNPESGRARSTSPYVSNQMLSQALSSARRSQANADRYSNILMREPESGVMMPDYNAIRLANTAQEQLRVYGIRRQEAETALKQYQAQYGSKLDLYGPFIDSQGRTIEEGMGALQMEYDQANQIYEDAFADYQKKQKAADYARMQEKKRKALQNEWAQYEKIQADKSKAETDAAEAWKKYYFMLPRAEDFASNQKNAYVSMDGKRVDSADYDSDVDGSAYFRDFLMTDEELAIMTYLRNTQGDEAARRYEDSLRSTENERMERRSLRYGAEHPVLASAGSVGMNIANEIAGPIGIVKAKLSGQEVDPEAEYFQAGRLRDAMRAGVMQNMGPVGQFVYQSLMSAVLDSGINGLIGAATGGSTWISAGLTAASGLTDMVRQIKERGGDDTQALVLGLIEGAAEIVTEKMGYDRIADLLTSKAPFKSAIKSVLGNMLSEFGEESATTVINQTADYLYGAISGRETEFDRRIDGYLSDGKTEGEALANALLDMGGETLMDGLGGALGGLVMGGGSAAINHGLSAAIAKYADYKSQGQTQTASQTAQETAQAHRNAQTTENKAEAENRAQAAQEAETMARIERLAQETADAEMGEQAARQEMRQTEQQRVRQAAQTTENASAESVHNAARVYGKDAASFESHYEGGALQNYRRAFDAVYQAGKVNLSLEQVNQAGGEIVSGLSEQSKAEIWQAGRNAAASVVVPGVSKQYVGKMNHNQRAQIRILDAIGKKYGIQIDVVNSLDYGRMAGNAALVGRNHIVVASDAMNSAYVQAGVHELVHNLRRESSAYYDAFSNVVLDTLKKDGSFDLKAAIAERIRQYAEQGQQLSEEDALEEIVAEAAPAALTNREAMRAFVKENRSLAEKVRDFFVRFADELRQIAAKYGVGNSRAEVDAMLRADARDLVAIAESLDMALSAAQEDAQEQSEAESSSEESEPQFSRKNGIEFATDKYSDMNVNTSAEIFSEVRELSDADTKFSLRKKEPPKKTLTAYKVFVAFENKPGQLFPPMVANPNGESTPVGVWLDADEGVTAKDKNGNELVNTLGRKQVKAGGKGTQGGSGALAYRPGWHLGELPMAKQFSRVNPETGVKELFPANFIWAECEIAADRNYQEEAMSYGYNKNGKFQHSLAGLPKLPTDGYYMYRTNPDPTTLPWYITGAMKVTKILSDAETDQILRDHGIEPMKRQGGPIDLEKFGFKAGEVGENGTKFSLKDSEAFKKWFGDSKVVDKNGDPLVVYHATDSEFNVFDRSKLGYSTSGNTNWQPAVRSAQIGFWFSDHDLAATVFTDPDKTKAVYLSIQKPYRTKLDSLWNALEHTRPETYVKRLQERGYDGLRVQDSEFGGVSYVAFEPTQIKSATNNSGAFDPANPDIRFSLKSPVEETKDLVAVHNLSEENLQKLLKLGGLPAPSIAIARAEFGYSAYGPISLVFDKNSIDPEANDKNRVYGADAWTPVVPSEEEYETPEDVVRAMYATQAERGEDRYLLDPEMLQALAAPEYKSIDDIKEDSGRLGYVNPYEHGFEVRNLNRQLNDVINRLVDDYDFAESDAEASIRRAATLEHNIDTVIESFASEEDGYHIDEEMAQEIIDLYEAAAAIPTEFFEAKPQRAVRFDEVKAAIVPESTSESLKNELKERVGQVIEYADGDEQARLEALNSLEEVKFSLKDTSEVDEQAKALMDGVDVEYNAEVVQAYARSALRAADKDAAKINQQVRQAAGKILKDTASKYDRKTLESNMRAIVEAYARDGGEGVSQAAAEMAKAIIEKNTHLDTTLRDQYSALRRDLRENGVSLTDSQKAEAASIYGSYNEFRRALIGTVKLTDKSMTLEARWDELSTMYPEIFRADTVEGDQINALMAFKQMMQPVYTNDFGMDMDTAAVDLGLRIQGDALSIAGAKEASKQLYGSAQKIENRVKKAYDAELKAQKKAKVAQFQGIAKRLAEAKKLGDTQGYDSAMADYRKLIRKETGVKMPGGEGMSPSAKMRFSQLAEAMQTAREANDTTAYQEAYKAYKELLKKERIQSTVVAPAVQDALNLARARFKANQEAKEGTVKKQKARQRVIKQAKALVDMLGNKKKGVRVPRMMQDSLLTLLEGLDINGRGAASKGEVTKQAAAMREQLTALRQTYQAIWNDQAKGEAPAVLDGLMMVINEEQRAQLDDALSILEQGGHFTLRSMTTEQLKALGDALMTVKQTISTIGVLWRKGRYNNVAELADASIQEMGKRPEAKLNAAAGMNAGRDFLALDMLEPVSYGERLGQAGSEIIQGLYEGEREKFGRLREAQTAAAAMMKDADVTSYDIGRWRNHVNTVRMGGHDVKLTDTQAMDIYLTAMRPQGKQHMLGNGIRLKTSKQTGAQVFTVRMTEADIAKVSDLLSDQQKRMAHKLQEYLAGDVAKWGNDVTQQLYLYDYFTEKTYWPLTSDPNVLKSKEPTTDFRLDALTNPGFMKPLNAGANNAVIIMDAFDVFNRHVAEMASYSGLAMPMIDAVNYLNYQQHDDDGLNTGSVKESMERLLGTGGQKYMTRLLQDLNHARHGDDLLALSKLGALYKKAAVTGKIRVVLQQPTAIARAAQEISPVYLAQGLKLGNKADIAEMEQHSALAWWKKNGSGMDIGVGRSADQVLWGNTSKAQTAMDKIETSGGLIDANRADAVTWAAMWRAVKRETQRIHPELQVGSDAYFKAVAERFDGIMDRTQVVDSVMHRSQIMRSQNGMVKELTAFKAEPIKSYNMLARAAMELGRNPKSRAAQAAVTRSALVFAANAALTALAEALFDVFKHRDDDDRLIEYLLDAKKGFLKEYTGEFLGSWLDNMNVIDLIPFATQAKDVLLNNDAPEMMSFDGLVSLRKAALTFNDHFVGENKQKTTTYGAIAPVLKAASQITGLPIAGIMANTEMLAKIADPQWLNYKAVSGKFADNYEALYAAILEGDKRAITRIRGRLAADTQGKSAKSPAQIDQGVANVLAEKDERIAQAYQLRKEGKSAQLVALKKQIMADGFTDAMVSAAINRYESQAKAQEKTTQEKDMDAQLTAKLFNYENLYAAMRTGSIEDVGIIAEYLQANSTAKDPATAIRSQVSGEFKQEYLDAVMNGGSAESLKQKLLSLGLTEDDLNSWVKDARYAEMKESVGEGDIADAKQTARELIDSGADVSNVVRSLNSKYRPLYIELINSGRTDEAEKLQKDLESLGLIKQKTGQNYYRKDYMDKWVTDYNNKNK